LLQKNQVDSWFYTLRLSFRPELPKYFFAEWDLPFERREALLSCFFNTSQIALHLQFALFVDPTVAPADRIAPSLFDWTILKKL
jgi:hypothetical protein